MSWIFTDQWCSSCGDSGQQVRANVCASDEVRLAKVARKITGAGPGRSLGRGQEDHWGGARKITGAGPGRSLGRGQDQLNDVFNWHVLRKAHAGFSRPPPARRV
ncbi:hypothetical protein NHX12_005282 [Muraenolepis orangiensis]|uniref:Uncharacterized protein n=1 Tax=Muraenolepis orangiensis TaxID=630683 RepID=A0A9Q0IBX2_9TELE|nr:hypothetical protein NHX12_005282 [Muraenolepis orangiensis]